MKIELQKNTSTLVKTASHQLVRLANKLLKKHQISHGYTPFLILLWEQDGRTQAELYRKIGIEQPTAVRTLDRMERDGLITRVKNPDDRREIIIKLTPKAAKCKANVYACAGELNQVALKGFSAKEQDQFRGYLKRVIENISSNNA